MVALTPLLLWKENVKGTTHESSPQKSHRGEDDIVCAATGKFV